MASTILVYGLTNGMTSSPVPMIRSEVRKWSSDSSQLAWSEYGVGWVTAGVVIRFRS